MSHVTTGIRKILESPIVYQSLMTFLGAHKFYNFFVNDILQAKSGDKILDIGCGTGKLFEYMPKGVIYTGFDLNQTYIDQANEKYGNRAKFYCRAVTKNIVHETNERFEKVTCVALLHHLDDEVILDLFDCVKSILSSNGKFYTIDPTYTHNQSKIAKFIMSKDRGQNIKNPEAYQLILQKVFNTVDIKVLNNFINIPYNHCITISK